MLARTRLVVLAAVVVALVALAAASAGCGGGSPSASPSPEWEEVVTTTVSGKTPVKLNLGTHQLGTQARLAWKLTGPDAPPVVLTFRLINADYGTGFGYSMTPETQGFKLDTENAMTVGPLKPGNFRIFFSQRFAEGEGPGYDGEVTVYTLK
ncbi:MAG: hypothetical protein ACM3MJ_07685 [Deltaproteobacteria bacterium]